jgi:hypothetical protein
MQCSRAAKGQEIPAQTTVPRLEIAAILLID